MRHVTLLLSTLLLLITTLLPAQAPERHDRVRIALNTDAGGLDRLAALGLAVDHGTLKSGRWIETDLSESEIAAARAAGFACDVLVEDVSAWYRTRNREDQGAPKAQRDWCNAQVEYPLPNGFELGSMAGYFTWQEMLDQLDAMRAAFPQLISVKQPIGATHEGRPIHFVRISNAPDVDQDKPEVLYDALHHAREPASLHQLITFMWHLLEGYGSDPEATYLIDHLELYFVPCLNPDGYVYNETIAPDGGGMWRKNRRDNGDGTFGVDLNRNYAQGWGADDIGSSSDPNSAVYRGPAPFSEPETQAIRDFCNAHTFRLALNNHTFGNLLIYPWGYQPSFYTPDSAVFVNHSVSLTQDNRYRFGTADQTVNYVVNGGSDDWMYGEQGTKPKIFAMTPEAGFGTEGFWPPASRIPTICRENIGPNLRLAHLALVHGLAEDRTAPIVGGSAPHVRFALQRLGLEPGTLTVSLEPLDNVVDVGEPIAFTAMDLLETRIDSIAITLDPFLEEGTTFRYVLAVDNGLFTHRDTLTKVFGQSMVLFVEDGTGLSEWQNNGWATTTSTWVSQPASVTDSPYGDYPSNANDVLTLMQPIDLGNATAAMLTFRAKWDLEAYYDHVQVLASADGVTWEALCGRHTRAGSAEQAEGEPVFDGQQPNWVVEEMSLNDYLGGPVRLRFRLRSDDGGDHEGFHFDDLMVTTTGVLPTGVDLTDGPSLMLLQPNPAVDRVWLTYALPEGSSNAAIVLYDARGASVRSQPLANNHGSASWDLTGLAGGIYHVALVQGDRLYTMQKLVVLRP